VSVLKTARLLTHRMLRGVGLSVQRWHDPYVDVQRLLSPSGVKTAVDGGAFHGGATRRLLQLFPGATVHAFEPQGNTRERLVTTFGGEKRVHIHPYALSDTTGTSQLHVNEQAYTTSLLTSKDAATITPREVCEVTITTLDQWAANESVAAPEFIKLDLQGHELAALRGATRLLSDVKAILAEVNFRSRYEGGCVFHEVAAHLAQFGFRLFRLYEIIPDPDGAWRQADALFVKAH
jgi:FkbM family methyltransferase